MFVKNFSDVISELQDHLLDYLKEHGINPYKQFSCLNPAHNDQNPSCGIVKGNPSVFNCNSCGTKGNIFKAAHFIENKPLTGPGFVADNLLYLAKKYNISIETSKVSPQDLYEIGVYKAYRAAADYISSTRTDVFLSAIKERGWTEEICSQYDIGSIQSNDHFISYMKEQGFKEDFLEEIDLSRTDIFNNDSLIFTFHDEHGSPVGFAARNLLWTKDKANGPKYVNQKTSGIKCNIFKKGERLYGLHRVKRLSTKDKPVFILEGYADVVSAAQKGIDSAVAVCSNFLNTEQLQTLRSQGYHNLTLCFDSDKGGEEGVLRSLDEVLSLGKELRVQVVHLPLGEDPDSFLREKGAKEFNKLKVWSAFEWRLNHLEENNESPESVCSKMIPLVVGEPSAINRESMINTLALHTGFSKEAIQTDVERQQNSKQAEMLRDRQIVLDELGAELRKYPSQAEILLQEAEDKLGKINLSYNEDTLSETEFLAALNIQKRSEEDRADNKHDGFVLGKDLYGLQEALKGSWKKDKWLTFGGRENVGKSALMAKLAFNIAKHSENNACVIYHTIDDTKEEIIPRLVCVAEGSKTLEINEVANPNYYIHVEHRNREHVLGKRESGYETIKRLAEDGRLIVKDANHGMTLSYAKKLIRYYKNKYPDRSIIYILDNFHRLRDFQQLLNNGGGERIRFKALSSQVKGLTTSEHCTIITTVEYNKTEKGVRPQSKNISETGQILYDANFICHLFNHLDEYGDRVQQYHAATVGNKLQKLPRIELIIEKNKVCSFKGSRWLDFFPSSSDFSFVTEEEVQKCFDAQKEAEEDDDDSTTGRKTRYPLY